MADLESVGRDALELINKTLPRFDQCDETFKKSKERIEKAVEELKQKWEAAKKDAEEFLTTIEDEQKNNEEEHNSTKSALDDLKKKVLDGKKDVEEDLEDGRSEVEEYGETNKNLESPIETLMKMVCQAAESLQNRAESIEQQLNSVCSDAASFLEGEIDSALNDIEENQTRRHNELGDWITQTATPDMTARKGDFATKLTDFETEMDSKFNETSEKASTESKSILDNVLGDFTNTIGQVMDFGQSLETVLGFLSTSVDTTGQAVGAAKDSVETCVKTSNITVESIMGCFEKFTKLANSFSFI